MATHEEIVKAGQIIAQGIEDGILNAPIIDIVVRKKGEWIEHNPHKWGLGIKYECSECGYEVDCEEPNFCPSCGSDMRGKKDD